MFPLQIWFPVLPLFCLHVWDPVQDELPVQEDCPQLLLLQEVWRDEEEACEDSTEEDVGAAEELFCEEVTVGTVAVSWDEVTVETVRSGSDTMVFFASVPVLPSTSRLAIKAIILFNIANPFLRSQFVWQCLTKCNKYFICITIL